MHMRKLLEVSFSSQSQEEFEHMAGIIQVQNHEGEKALSKALNVQKETLSGPAPPTNHISGAPRLVAQSTSTWRGSRGTTVW